MPSYNNQISDNARAIDYGHIRDNNTRLKLAINLRFAEFGEITEQLHENEFIHNEEVRKTAPLDIFHFRTEERNEYEAFYKDIHWYDGFNGSENWGYFILAKEGLGDDEEESPILKTKNFQLFKDILESLY